MTTPKQQIKELQDAADALCDWFDSQDIGPGKAVGIMSYLIGAMAVADTDGKLNSVTKKLELAHNASLAVALAAITGKKIG